MQHVLSILLCPLIILINALFVASFMTSMYKKIKCQQFWNSCPLWKPIHFPRGCKSLNRLWKKMGFKWKKCQPKRKLLIEKTNIVIWCHSYLVKIRNFREAGHEIYIDESWMDNNMCFSKWWQSGEEFGVQANTILETGNVNGFIPNA